MQVTSIQTKVRRKTDLKPRVSGWGVPSPETDIKLDYLNRYIPLETSMI